MIRHIALGAAAALGACAAPGSAPAPAAPQSSLVARSGTDAEGRCWAFEPVPAIYEQVPGQVQVVQAETAPDGTVTRPAVWRNATVPKVVRPRGSVRFETPCPETMTPALRASLQRALKARGIYRGPVTGEFDAATRAAIRTFQSARGLDSGRLSLETARALGLVAVPPATPADANASPERARAIAPGAGARPSTRTAR